MKRKNILIGIIAIFIAACSTSKKSTTSASSSTPVNPASTNTTASPADNYVLVKSTGFHSPGNEELIAMRAKYNDVTLEKLKEGHALYTKGACVSCHGANNIYNWDEAQWKGIIENMAYKAQLSDEEKDAVYKYVLAIKATQPK